MLLDTDMARKTYMNLKGTSLIISQISLKILPVLSTIWDKMLTAGHLSSVFVQVTSHQLEQKNHLKIMGFEEYCKLVNVL